MKLIALSTPVDLVTGDVETINFTSVEDTVIETRSIGRSHPSFAAATDTIDSWKAGALTQEELAAKLMELADVATTVQERLLTVDSILDGRLTIFNGRVTVDGDAIDPVLETFILKMLREDGSPRSPETWVGFAKFVENLYGNMSAFVRNQLFGWLNYEATSGHGFTLTDDGCFVGYKGCAGTVELPTSISTGTAFVDGVKHEGRIPNAVGAVVTMPRSSVQDDPSVGCSAGLHVGTYSYASGWSRGVLLKVKVNPRDVVSVPTECSAQKIRTCRYEVLEITEGPDNGLIYTRSSRWSSIPEADEETVSTLQEAKAARFTYSGKEREVTIIEVHDSLGSWAVEAEEDGTRKTFYVGRMSNVEELVPVEDAVRPEADDAAEAEAKAAAVQALTELEARIEGLRRAVDGGVSVRFVYNNVERFLIPEQLWGDAKFGAYISGIDDRRVKTFKVAEMSSVRF